MALWQAAAGDRHPLPPALWDELTAFDPGFRPEDLRVAFEGETPIGFALTKQLRAPADLPKFQDRGWIALMAVHPEHQRQGVGTALLAEAEQALKAAGKTAVNLGESLAHAMPGIPEALTEGRAFFQACGYEPTQEVWDVRGDVATAQPPELPAGVTARVLAADEAGALLHFLNETFPGRWAQDMGQYLVEGRPIWHVMGLFEGGQLRGFAQLHLPGSPGALRWAGFNPDVAALGPIGVSKDVRGRGLGLGLLQAGLAHLASVGATDTVIDWTTLLEFYGRVGFKPWLRYQQARKELA
ncbi:MAG: family N-acetyltransferase [Cyanobacteria bacterium RYN_339]|nr:family N-acetyltransferase [Cyanobacteria bacterium RYN_339]